MRTPKTDIAILGYSCRLPGAQGTSEFWKLLDEARCAVTRIPADRFPADRYQHPDRLASGKSVSFAAGVVEKAYDYDPGFFGISPREAIQMDPQQRMLTQVVWEALEQAGIKPSTLKGSNTGVFVGASSLDHMQIFASDAGSTDAQLLTGNTLSIISNRISFLLDLRGPSFTVDTACSSSLVALHQACEAIASGATDTAIVGGVNFLTAPYPFCGFSRAFMLSEQGLCRAFDAKGDGYVRAEGAVAIVIQSADAARANANRARARIVGWGTNCDGRTPGMSMPSSESQADLLRRVYADFAINPDDLAFVEAHGTGTPVGDPIEARAIGDVLGRPRSAPLPIGSVKTNVGHLEPASGLAGLLKAILALEHNSLPPSLHFETPNSHIPFDELNISVAKTSVPLAQSRRPRYAGINSFGFGGANAHIVITDGDAPRAPKPRSAGPILVSGASRPALHALARQYADILPKQKAGLAAFASATAWKRELLDHRAFILPGDREATANALNALADGVASPHVVAGHAPVLGKVIFAFSGNGSQWAGMGLAALESNAAFRKSFVQSDKIFEQMTGNSLLSMLKSETLADDLASARVSQPLLFAIQLAAADALAELGIKPAAVIGHSAGEVAAACVAGILTRKDALLIIEKRSINQEPLRGKGAMAALILPEADAEAALADPEFADIDIAATNTARSLTLSGAAPSLQAFLKHARKQRWPYVRLDIAYPFHSRQLEPFRDALIADIAHIKPRTGHTPFISTVTGTVLPGETLDADYWWRNMRARVRFEQAIQTALTLQPRLFLEVGPSPVLTSYMADVARQAGAGAQVLSSLDRKDEATRDPLLLTAARVLVHGGEVDLAALFPPPLAEDVDLPGYAWQNEEYRVTLSPEAGMAFRPDVHPLLGVSQFEDTLTFYRHFDQETLPWLADHKVQDATIVPAAAVIEMSLAGAREALGDIPVEISQSAMQRPLVITPGATRQVISQVVAHERLMTIESQPRGSHEEQTLHAKCRYAASPAHSEPAPEKRTDAIRRGDTEDVYRLMSAYRLNYGPAFRRIASVIQYDEKTIDFEFLPAAEGLPNFLLDPTALDAAFHAGLWLLHGDRPLPSGAMTYVPTYMERIRLFRPGAQVCGGRLVLTRKSVNAVMDYLALIDSEGEVVATLEGGRFMRVPLNVDATEPTRYETVLAPLASRSSLSTLAAIEPDLNLLTSASSEHSSAAGMLDRTAVAALDVLENPHSEAITQLPTLVAELLSSNPEMISEALACSAIARRIPGRSIEQAATASPCALAIYETALTILSRTLNARPNASPLRVLVCGLGNDTMISRFAALLPVTVGSLTLTDRDSSRVARLQAMRMEFGDVHTVEWSQLELTPLAFDLAIVCDPLGIQSFSRQDCLTLHAALAHGGLAAVVEYAGNAFAQLVRASQGNHVDISPVNTALAESGMLQVAVQSCGSRYGRIIVSTARKPVVEEIPETALATRRTIALHTIGSSSIPGLSEALHDAGIDIANGADSASDKGDVLVVATDSNYDSATAGITLTLSDLTDIVKNLGAEKRKVFVILSNSNGNSAAAASIRVFLRVAGNEYPHIEFRTLDIETQSTSAAILAELALDIVLPRRDRELVLREGGISARRAVVQPIKPGASDDGNSYSLEIPLQGSLERLRWQPRTRREPSPDEVEIEVEATGLNFRDVMWSLGLLPPEALEDGFAGATLGMECAGRAIRVGKNVKDIAEGDPVVAFAPGSFASHVTVPAFAVAPRPAAISAEAAATLPVAFLTCWYALVHLARVEEGETVLVHGGAGGVGLAAIQILKRIGARIIATAGTPEKRQLLLDLGVDHALDSRTLAFADKVQEITNGEGVDVVLNSLAGEAMERSIDVLKSFGRFIELGKRDFFGNTRIGLRPFRKNLSYFGVDADQLLVSQSKLAKRLFADVMKHFLDGNLMPLPWRAYASEDVTAAFRLMQQSGHIGKIVIRPPQTAAAPKSPVEFARRDGAYVIVGGLGGFGLAFAQRLAARGAGCIILVGRRGTADEAGTAIIESMVASGCEVIIKAADASDRGQLKSVLDSIPASRTLRGVCHAAMVLDDTLIANLDASRIEPVLRSKIAVAENLDRITADANLDWFLLFSSASALIGNPGQANYAAANAWLEEFARQRRERGLPALAIGWGAISDVGYLTRGGEASKTLLQRLNRHAMSSTEALDGLEMLLRQGKDAAPSAAYARLDWSALTRDLPIMSTMLFSALRREGASVSSSSLLEELAQLSPEQARTRVLAELASEIGKIMRIPPSDVDMSKGLAELGIDSLMGVELRLAAEEKFGVDVPLMSIGSAGSLNDLANLVLKQIRGNTTNE